MSNIIGAETRSSELGAVSIKVVLIFLIIGVVAFLVVKIAPVYVDDRQVTYKLDDLANKSAVRNAKEEVILREIEAIRKEYDLPADSINLVSREQGKVQISINYQKDIDLLVTTYPWKVARTISGKDL